LLPYALDAADADLLDEHVRRHQRQPRARMAGAGVDQRDRRTVRVATSTGESIFNFASSSGSATERLVVHEAHG
jgi:hypothetical protein